MAYMAFVHDGSYHNAFVVDIFPGNWDRDNNEATNMTRFYRLRIPAGQHFNFWDVSPTNGRYSEENDNWMPKSFRRTW